MTVKTAAFKVADFVPEYEKQPSLRYEQLLEKLSPPTHLD